MKRAFRYFSSFSSVLIMAASFVSFAQETEPVIMKKSVTQTPDADGNYYITMETYVTGEAIEVEREVHDSADIVLVLDTSGSMGDDYPQRGYIASDRSFSYSDCTDGTYYYYFNGNYYPVKRLCVERTEQPFIITYHYYYTWLYFEVSGVRYYLKGTEVREAKDTVKPTYNGKTGTQPVDKNGNTISATSDSRSSTVWTGTLYTYSTYDSKLEALKAAVAKFINIVHEDAVANGTTHRISIIQLNNDDFPGTDTKYTDPNNSNYLYEQSSGGYTSVVKHFLKLDKDNDNTNTLISAVNGLSKGGDTAADYAMRLAYLVLDSYANPESQKTVVMFTDGVPNYYDDPMQDNVANGAIDWSYKIKNMDGDKKPSVFTIGIFGKFVEGDGPKVEKYMNGVSSNYPQAKSIDNLGTKTEEANFYRNAKDASLDDIFITIAKEITVIGGASIEVTKESQVLDVVTNTFQLPKNFDADNISVKVSKYDPSTKTFSSELSNPAETITRGFKTNTDGTTNVTITGYPFSEHWCGDGCSADKAEKLVITVPIKPIDKLVGGSKLKTNSDETSGLYLEDGTMVGKFTSPTLSIPITIEIEKQGLKKGESAIFNIYSSKDSYANAIRTLMVTKTDEAKNPTGTVVNLDPQYEYKIVEGDWSWSYEITKGKEGYFTKDQVTNPFIFINSKNTDIKNAEATVINKFEKITK